MKNYYKNISNTLELKALQEEADKSGKTAVGITNSGRIYIYDKEKKGAKSITEEDLSNYLDLEADQINKIIETKGQVSFEEEEIKKEIEQKVTNQVESERQELFSSANLQLDILRENLINQMTSLLKEFNTAILEALKNSEDVVLNIKEKVEGLSNKLDNLFLD